MRVCVCVHCAFSTQGLRAAVSLLELFLSISKPLRKFDTDRTMKREPQLRNEQKEVTDFGLLCWGKWTIKCNFRLNRCFMYNMILILFLQAEAEELCAARLGV